MRQKAIVAMTLAAVLALSGAGWTTSLVRLDTKTLTLRSDAVVTAQVSRPPKPVKEGKMTYTEVTLLVENTIKAAPQFQNAQYIRVKQLGGTYNGITTVVPGMPSFRTGERVLVFLRQDTVTKNYNVVGLSQGKYEILTDPETGEDYIVQHLSQTASVPVQHAPERVGFNLDLGFPSKRGRLRGGREASVGGSHSGDQSIRESGQPGQSVNPANSVMRAGEAIVESTLRRFAAQEAGGFVESVG
jgi:hypothetical protein